MTPEMQAIRWLASGDTGVSSECLVYAALGQLNKLGWLYRDGPYDPDDLGRCLRMMKQLPWVREKAFKVLRNKSMWKQLIPRWDELEKSMADEVGIDWSKGDSAPKTYALMKQILK